MKILCHLLPSSTRARFLFLISLAGLPLHVFGQGSLTPSGTPGPTMKSLDQIEARTPISSLPFVVGTGGSYYLTKSLSIASGDAITISASGTTLDLNGFEITSTEPSPAHTGVVIGSGLRNVRIMNGQIRGNVVLSGSTFSGSGFANGIVATGTPSTNVNISNVSVSGVLSSGINLTFSGTVEFCSVNIAGNVGISADSVVYSTAYQCGIGGIRANSVASCSVSLTSTGNDGITAQIVTGSSASGNVPSGEGAINASVARDCYAVATSGAGDGVLSYTAENCQGFSNGAGSGIHAFQTAISCSGRANGTGTGVNVAGTAFDCYGIAGTGSGISAAAAENSYGTNSGSVAAVSVPNGAAHNCYGTNAGSGPGIAAATAESCYGVSTTTAATVTTIGISAQNATGCYGASSVGNGIQAISVANCYGTSSGTAGGTSAGIFAQVAQNCYGINTSPVAGSGYGIFAGDAMNCRGEAAHSNQAGGFGVFAGGTAFACDGGSAVGAGVTYFCRPTSNYP